MHVHGYCKDGEAKFWLEPEMELARSFHLSRAIAGNRKAD
jgi:hypothetical protein